MRRRDHQSGFSTSVILLAVLVVAALALTGVVVYQHHKSNTAKSNAATNSSQTTGQQSSTTGTQPQPTTYLTITEWGVRMALNSTTASLYYYINPQVPDVAFLSLKAISDVAPSCAADKGALATIGRQTSAERQDALNKGLQAGTVQIGNYWYAYDHSHADCADTPSDTTASLATKHAAMKNALPNFDASTLGDTFKTLEAVPTTN